MIFEKLAAENMADCRLGWADCLEKAAAVLPEDCRIMDVGASHGSSAIIMSYVTRSRRGLVYSVEPGYLAKELWDSMNLEKINHDDIHSNAEIVMSNAYRYGIIGQIIPLPGVSWDLVKMWDPQIKLDMLVIDGLHNYIGVKGDLLWAQFLKPKAIIIFDDWIQEVEKAAMEYMNAHTDFKPDGRFGVRAFSRGY
jgi:precorrin-6B methylase 2